MRSEGFTLGSDQEVRVDIVRLMLDDKMAGILSEAGGASCQLCKATHKELSDRRMCEELPEVVIQHSTLQSLLQALLDGLASVPRVATNTCWAFISLAEAAYNIVLLGDEDDPESYALSQVYEELVTKLLNCTERNESTLSNLKSAAYETLIEVLYYTNSFTISSNSIGSNIVYSDHCL
ncbi:Importin subunit beta-1-like [Oopsacas minuta]|uniref:Importin subunit beta-1-like n=1 Tax=Oopsacas minuta TaxID=111878 RepID=A0AAV7JVK6_9METZ|nr:Importin subunit beta-1-like [Oopsacas minuta]